MVGFPKSGHICKCCESLQTVEHDGIVANRRKLVV